MDFIEQLNPSQQEAVKTTKGPVLIIAGAGSGKTKVLTVRVAYLLRNGVAPGNILAVTFTNKAAQEMKERIKFLTGQKEMPWVGTFHGVAAWILRAEKHPYEKFVIYDEADQLSLVKEVLKEHNLAGENFRPAFIKELISKAKNELTDEQNYRKLAYAAFEKEVVSLVYQSYQKKLKDNRALDFDDLLFEVLKLFQQKSEVLEKYQERFRYLLVDEYQDTNTAQYQFINKLAQKYKNLCVVGDVDQAIYGWRGADFRNILNFEKDYPQARIFKLEENYRSTQNILSAANSVIEKNIFREEKILWTQNPGGEKISILVLPNQSHEAKFVITKIQELLKANFSLKDMVVLYRTNAQSRVLEEACLKAGMAYRIVGAYKFYERKEIKDLISYLRIIEHPFDLVSWKRIINVPSRGLANLDNFWPHVQKNGLNHSSFELLPKKKQAAFSNFLRLIEHLGELKEKLLVSDLLKRVIKDTGYLQYINGGSAGSQDRLDNISELASVGLEFDQYGSLGLEKFLESVALIQESDHYDENKNVLNLMTLHSVKGLEFPVVFITGLEEGIFPHLKAESPEALEEERRLCYVGLTRSKEKVYLTFVRERKYFGATLNSSPSRFLLDIPAHLVEFNEGEPWDPEEIFID